MNNLNPRDEMPFLIKAKVVVRLSLAIPALAFVFACTACGGRILQKTEAEVLPKAPAPVPDAVPLWLGNPTRNFYGTGPWPDRPLEVLWEFETKLISGRLHKDGWGGTSWPGQPSVAGNRVYFGSADGYLYCLDKRDGSLIWKFKTEDSLKATPTIAGDKIIASGLDHYIYCLDANDGSLIWKYKTGFE
ncbi:MAG: PQQ-binding-like beta-propeller repeat protein, partial [Pyrinomonadaceae bacterium]